MKHPIPLIIALFFSIEILWTGERTGDDFSITLFAAITIFVGIYVPLLIIALISNRRKNNNLPLITYRNLNRRRFGVLLIEFQLFGLAFSTGSVSEMYAWGGLSALSGYFLWGAAGIAFYCTSLGPDIYHKTSIAHKDSTYQIQEQLTDKSSDLLSPTDTESYMDNVADTSRDKRPTKKIVAIAVDTIQPPKPEPMSPLVSETGKSNQVKPKNIWPMVVILGAALIVVTIVMGAFIYKSVVQTAQIADLQDTVTSQKERLSLTWEKVDEQSQRANELAREYLELKSHIAIVIEDSRYYHTYDCEQWRSADGYWIYNVEQMSNMSYKPCPYCH